MKVEEPTEDVACTMLRGIVARSRSTTTCAFSMKQSQRQFGLSHRYIAGRQLPDKAVQCLDTACARLSLGQNSTPPRLEDIQRQLDSLEVQKRVLERETKIGADHEERLGLIETQIAAAKEEETILKEQWEKEKGLIEKIRALQEKLESAEKKDAEPRQRAPRHC